jgi:hypothetical protein
MIFPQPIKESYGEGKYLLLDEVGEKDLLSLYEKYREGNGDITYCTVDGYREDEYSLRVGDTGVIVSYGKESGRFRLKISATGI